MRIETALKKRDAAKTALVDLYSRAAHYGLPSSAIKEWNATHKPGRLSRKAEFEQQ